MWIIRVCDLEAYQGNSQRGKKNLETWQTRVKTSRGSSGERGPTDHTGPTKNAKNVQPFAQETFFPHLLNDATAGRGNPVERFTQSSDLSIYVEYLVEQNAKTRSYTKTKSLQASTKNICFLH